MSTRAIKSFRPGLYRHYKGQHYLALGLARNDDTDEPMVVYTRLYSRHGLPMTVRRLAVWNEKVELGSGKSRRTVARFEFVGNVQP